jgi:diadenosine tetraphosphate (Ap4A) HIT family hydrolase
MATAEPTSTNNYEDICTFCREATGEAPQNLFYDHGLAKTRSDYVLFESDHHVVFPCIGALTDWYVLIVSRRHALSVGWLEPAEQADLRQVIDHLRTRLGKITGQSVMVFEHGSFNFRDKGGACYDHAHVHVVATTRPSATFVDAIPAPVTMTPCTDWINAATTLIQGERRSYVALDDGHRHLVGEATGAPSQFFRRCLAAWLGAEDGEWDWLTFPQLERVTAMLATSLR